MYVRTILAQQPRNHVQQKCDFRSPSQEGNIINFQTIQLPKLL